MDKTIAALLGCSSVLSVIWIRKVWRNTLIELKRKQRVGVGIGVVVYKPLTGEIMMGLRKGSHGANTWALPGGWLEIGEEFITCALREVEEETGLKQSDLGPAKVIDVAPSNNIMSSVHSASVFVQVPLLTTKEPHVMEPDKCERWEWFSTRSPNWPDNIFPSAKYLLQDKKLTL